MGVMLVRTCTSMLCRMMRVCMGVVLLVLMHRGACCKMVLMMLLLLIARRLDTCTCAGGRVVNYATASGRRSCVSLLIV